MISVENFYWVLSDVLLKPLNFDCKYHYPFGSTQFLSQREFIGFDGSNNHVVFRYDQEPIWQQVISEHYDSTPRFWSSRDCKILANSEHSEIKKSLCKTRDMMDWYFFYHGFAALDWFRDAQFIESEFMPVYSYLNLNNLTKIHRSYRISLLSRLAEKKLLTSGLNSFHASIIDITSELRDPNTNLNMQEICLIQKFLESNPRLPMTIDRENIGADASAHFGLQEYRLWQQSAVHLVNETVFYHPKLHLTEKIFKPIVACRPFLLVAAPGNLAYLRSYGFQTFEPWIDESYDLELDPRRRLDLITQQIEKLCVLSPIELKKMLADMKSVLHYNKQHFFGSFKKIIVDEMIENFTQCLLQWNNCRWKDRVELPKDVSHIKRLLCR